METVGTDPPLILDAAHNPDGARALAEAIAATAVGRPAFAALAVLADKDAEGIVAALAPACAGIVATEVPVERLAHAGRPGARPMPAAQIAAAARAAGIDPVAEAPTRARPWSRVRELAARRRRDRRPRRLALPARLRERREAGATTVAIAHRRLPRSIARRFPSTVSPCWTGRRDPSCST